MASTWLIRGRMTPPHRYDWSGVRCSFARKPGVRRAAAATLSQNWRYETRGLCGGPNHPAELHASFARRRSEAAAGAEFVPRPRQLSNKEPTRNYFVLSWH